MDLLLVKPLVKIRIPMCINLLIFIYLGPCYEMHWIPPHDSNEILSWAYTSSSNLAGVSYQKSQVFILDIVHFHYISYHTNYTFTLYLLAMKELTHNFFVTD